MKDQIRDDGGESDPNTTGPSGGEGGGPASNGRFGAAGLAFGVAILFGGTVGYLFAQAQRDPSGPTLERRVRDPNSEERISVERQLAVRRLGAFIERPFVATDSPTIVLSGFVAAMSLAPPFEAIDSALFDAGDKRIRLARILPVGRKEVCLDGEGRRFACGLMGRATLQNFLARHDVICLPLFTAKDKQHDFVEADCRVEGVDVAEHVVRSGFAFPATFAGSRLERALVAARDERAGVWRGPYLVPETDPAIEDAGEVEVSSLRTVPAVGGGADTPGTDGGRGQVGSVVGGGRVEAGTDGGKERPRVKRQPAAQRADPIVPSGPRTTASRPPARTDVPQGANPGARSGVVAGPILPPPEALARKLGIAPSTSGGEPSDPVRGPSDR